MPDTTVPPGNTVTVTVRIAVPDNPTGLLGTPLTPEAWAMDTIEHALDHGFTEMLGEHGFPVTPFFCEVSLL